MLMTVDKTGILQKLEKLVGVPHARTKGVYPKIVATGKHVCQGGYSLKEEQGIVKKMSEEDVNR